MDKNFTCKEDDSFFAEDLDGFKCGLATMALILYNINFGHICTFLLLLIAIVSIFGKIQDEYRWFILNQVIWDLLLSYRFVCNNYIGLWFYKDYTCYSNSKLINAFLDSVPFASYSALLLLSASRFLCLYFPTFYEKLIKGGRVLVTIFVYNFVVVVTSLSAVFSVVKYSRITEVLCPQTLGTDKFKCYANPPYDFTYNALKTGYTIQVLTSASKPPICLFLSIIATILMILKISKQFKFLSKNNKKGFYISLRITVVIAFQTILYLFIFCLEAVNDFILIAIDVFDNSFSVAPESLPTWFTGVYGLSWPHVIHNFLQIRIFIECLIILFIMSGYREAVFAFVKYIPSKLFERNQTSVTVISTSTVRTKPSINVK